MIPVKAKSGRSLGATRKRLRSVTNITSPVNTAVTDNLQKVMVIFSKPAESMNLTKTPELPQQTPARTGSKAKSFLIFILMSRGRRAPRTVLSDAAHRPVSTLFIGIARRAGTFPSDPPGPQGRAPLKRRTTPLLLS